MWQFALMGLKSGWRSHVARLILFVGVALIGIAWVSGNFATRAPQTVGFDVGFSLIRIVMVLLGLFWVQELFAKDLERKTAIFALAYPVARWKFLVGRLIAITLLCWITISVLAILLLFTVKQILPDYQQAFPLHLGHDYLLPFAGLYLDMLVIIACGILISTLSETPFLPFFTGIIFAFSARGLGAALAYLQTGNFSPDQLGPKMAPVIKAMSWVLPDLGRLDWRQIVSYGTWPDTSIMLLGSAQAVAYAVVFIFIAAFIFARRELV
ncbi:hypothetical protein KSF73_01515 [Burkholderiaceae bacterium DAT-1]|nr:hypothetical protein [Burkholderiaceae bacterium DAT-1]